jgi:hypothetical protein
MGELLHARPQGSSCPAIFVLSLCLFWAIHRLIDTNSINESFGSSIISTKNVTRAMNSSLDCVWWGNASLVWGDTNGPFSNLLKQAQDSAWSTFSGRSVLVLGGSTSRDLAADFMQMVLPSPQRLIVAQEWKRSGTEGYALFPAINKRANDFEKMYHNETMAPLLKAGWKFERLFGSTSGCSDCHSSYTNLDYVATYEGGAKNSSSYIRGTTYEFSWKPEIFAPKADTIGFEERYCKNHYDVVHIGRGLHDSAFKNVTYPLVRERFLSLAQLVKCFPSSTLVILRTPYLSTKSNAEDEANKVIRKVSTEMVCEGHFGPNRSILIDGYHITSAEHHPIPFDGHHYKSRVARAYWSVLALAALHFFHSDGKLTEELTGKWEHCGLGVAC